MINFATDKNSQFSNAILEESDSAEEDLFNRSNFDEDNEESPEADNDNFPSNSITNNISANRA